MATNALIVVDVQNDFVAGGSLAVPAGNEVVPVINELMQIFFRFDDLVVATQDWHPANHKSFASQYTDLKPFDVVDLHGFQQVLWPDHCVQETQGAAFCEDLLTVPFVFCKGEDVEVDSYSGFYDNGGKNETQLHRFLTEKGVKRVYVTGLALDYCVKFTALDAVKLGYKTTVVLDATRPVVPAAQAAVIAELEAAGVRVVSSGDVIGEYVPF